MEKENTKGGGNGLEFPKVGDQGMGDEVQIS
jgi:hypothetical protein